MASIAFNPFLRACAAALVASALVGCASATGPVAYPASWPPIDPSKTPDGCPPLSGTYANEPSGGFPEGTRPSLTEVFARMASGRLPPKGAPWAVPPQASSVTFRLDPERLSVAFADTDAAEAPLAFRRYHFNWSEKRYDDLYTCYPDDGPRLRFMAEPESHSLASPIYVEGGGTIVYLLKASDGGLIVQWRSESIAISAIVLGTHMKFQSVWWRYPPVTPDN